MLINRWVEIKNLYPFFILEIMLKPILICGLPGSGKTSLAKALTEITNAVHWNADEVRQQCADSDFSLNGRIRQASRMRWLCDTVLKTGQLAIADFVCPISETRAIFDDAFIIFVDRIQTSRFENTNSIWTKPDFYHVRIPPNLTITEELNLIIHHEDFSISCPQDRLKIFNH